MGFCCRPAPVSSRPTTSPCSQTTWWRSRSNRSARCSIPSRGCPDVGKLYVVSTPIGNLEDVSFRALRVLREVSLIAAEDTRVTRKLLSRYDIHTRLVPYHQHSQRFQTGIVLRALD